METLIKLMFSLVLVVFFSVSAFATPHWDVKKIPRDSDYPSLSTAPLASIKSATPHKASAIDILRIQVDWQMEGELFVINKLTIEPSGTPALIARSTHKPALGSYLGILKDNKTGAVYYDAVGTGKEYRILNRAMSFRYPLPNNEMTFELLAENPITGVMETVLTQTILPSQLTRQANPFRNVVIKELQPASKSPVLRVNIYSEGYLATEQEAFWHHANKAVQALQNAKFPGIEHMSFYGVFYPSSQKLGAPRDLGYPIPEYNTFLGLFYPYWGALERWYNVVYPTREDKFRQALAVAPYDYPLVLTHDSHYWGVGNYMALTAIPAVGDFFNYLLLHEIGHFFGLNEEYEGGGRTELEFASGIEEPWSQNITFLRNQSHSQLKWNQFVAANTKLPTPYSDWRPSPPVYGAYIGGYGDSKGDHAHSHKPGLKCIMDRYQYFCDICRVAILDVVSYGTGISSYKNLA